MKVNGKMIKWKEKEGKGIKYFNAEPFKGDRYEGELRNGKFEGKGIYYCKNGDKYEGEWRNDNPEGKGIFNHKHNNY